MKGFTIGLLVAAGVVGWWAARRATASSRAPTMLADQSAAGYPLGGGATATPNVPTRPTSSAQDSIDPKMVVTPKNIDPKMVVTPKNIDPKMVVNPPPPRSPEDKTHLKPRPDQ